MQNKSHSIEQGGGGAKLAGGLLPTASLLVAATLWGVFWYPLRLLEQQGLHGLWAALLIYVGTLVVALPMVAGRLEELRRAPRALLILALASGWTNIAFILAMLEGQVVRVLLLFYLSPLWATLMGVVLLKERLTRLAVMVLVLAMTGALIMLWHPDIGAPWPEGRADWLALSSGFAFALSNVMVRQAQAVSVRVKTVAAWLGVIGLAGLLVLLMAPPPGPLSAVGLVGALALGAVGIVVMTLTVQYGVTHMPVHRSAVILLFEVLVGAVSAQLLADESVHWREWLGGSLILLAAYLIGRSGR